MSAQEEVNLNLLREVKLYANNQQRAVYDNKADLFAIVQTMEHLEKAYIKDSITPREYTPTCEKLIAQFKTCMNLLKEDVGTLEQFMKEYKMSCPAAFSRLQIGVPATIELGGMGESDQRLMAKYVAETVQYFITLMDSLKLGIVAVDEINPYLNDILESMQKVTTLPSDFEGKITMREWLKKTNAMKASDELTEDDVRQLSHDLEKAHTAFYRSLS